jgi:hypothetical protein
LHEWLRFAPIEHNIQCVAKLVTCYGTSHPSLAANCTKYPSYKFRRPRKKRLSVGTVIIIATEEQERKERKTSSDFSGGPLVISNEALHDHPRTDPPTFRETFRSTINNQS